MNNGALHKPLCVMGAQSVAKLTGIPLVNVVGLRPEGAEDRPVDPKVKVHDGSAYQQT